MDVRPVRLLLADDHGVFRDALKLLLASLPSLEIVAEADHAEQVRELAQIHEPELVLLDYHMPGGDGGMLLDYLKRRFPGIKVAMLTGAQSPTILRQLAERGADAVLLKSARGTDILDALRRVIAGERVLPSEVQALVADAAGAQLTPRELQVLGQIYAGRSNAEIAASFALSPKTVDKHRENLMRKLQVNSTAQLVKKVHELKLLDESS